MNLKQINYEIAWLGNCVGHPAINVIAGENKVPNENIIEEILKIPCNKICFTGKNIMQEQQLHIIKILSMIDKRKYYVLVETDGTVLPDINLRGLVDEWVVIPQETYKGSDGYLFYSEANNAWFDLPISGELDHTAIKKLVYDYSLPWKKIILTPVAELEEAESKIKEVSGLVLEYGCRLGNPVMRKTSGVTNGCDKRRNTELAKDKTC